MDLEYDEKFEEMKKYTPFLENMIRRLEETCQSPSNPRQAQLDKIRSLRDLLLNKKKRMKMQNLLKCEQVLVNLHAKVEQREKKSAARRALDPRFSIDPPTPQEKSDLAAVRNKLKTVVKREKEEVQDTLPEILRVNEFEDVHTAGSKEPALFQRRPNKASLSPTHTMASKNSEGKVSPSSGSKRNYTRVLVSPESNSKRWLESETSTEEKPLFSRRSPRRSPRRHSPAYHKRERKKSSKESSTPRKAKDLNITLNVPEDSLSSLNTKDIFTRIINCRDSDVDIDTLRELRKQILTELQKTGAREDISDLILKSYKNKTEPKKEEVEEGELSDSESEVIENIYGNLVLKDPNDVKGGSDKSKPRKIQICLVINSEKEKPDASAELPKKSDFLELEMYDKESKVDKGENLAKNVNTSSSVNEEIKTSSIKEDDKTGASKDNLISTSTKLHTKPSFVKEETKNNSKEGQITLDTNKDDIKSTTNNGNTTTNKKQGKTSTEVIKKNSKLEVITIDDNNLSTNTNVEQNSTDQKSKQIVLQNFENHNVDKKIETQESVQNKANFYKPITSETKTDVTSSKTSTTTGKNVDEIAEELQKMENSVKIPLLNEPTVHSRPTDNTVSEIDILQALKNEILSESITLPGSEATPLLHQPKLTKVASSKDTLSKKRISIEKYKEKVVTTPKLHLDENVSAKEDHSRKTSLKLTEKECERFNIPTLSYDEDSSSGDGDILTKKVYSGLAPKSPDNDDSSSIGSLPPVIIPADPVKVVPVHKVDVDMRTLPILSTKSNAAAVFDAVSFNCDLAVDKKSSDTKLDRSNTLNKPLIDPRKRRDSNVVQPSNQYSSPHTGNIDRTSRSIYSNNTPSPANNTVSTPNARNAYEMTPSHQQSFETDQLNNRHVYVPTLSSYESRDRENSVARDSRWDKVEQPIERKSRFDDHGDASWSSSDVSQSTRYSDSFTTGDKHKLQRNDRYSIDNRDSFLINKRAECSQNSASSFGRSDLPMSSPSYGILDKPMTPLHSFGRSDCPSTPSHPFGRLDCPSTPSHPFGRSECPSTPSHQFGRSECPPTPIHQFGRIECPSTPSHPFGRSECPPTPSHTFGRSECPPTPSHPFGRSECPSTPTHSFGAGECPPTTNLYGRIDSQPTHNHPFGLREGPQTPNHLFGRSETTTNQFIRSELNTQKYTKDPRLSRKDYDTNSHYEDRDRASYKDREYYRENSYKTQKSFSGSDTYHTHERERGRNSKYRYFGPDQSNRHLQNNQPRNEHRAIVTIPNSSENDPRQRGRFNNETRGRGDFGFRHSNQREKSVGRETSIGRDARERSVSQKVRAEDNFTRNSSRAQSVGRTLSIDLENKTLSVQAHAGRSFSIDTSVNATFQNFLERSKGVQLFEQNFDDRRRRAASVGRSLVRTPKERSYTKESTPSTDVSKKREHFRRASSVGRDLVHCALEKKSFQEIKADFKTYRFPANAFCKFDTGKIRNIDTKPKTSTDHFNRSRKYIYDKQKEERRVHDSLKLSDVKYSPRRNNRDPRMRREYDAKTKYDFRSGDPRSRKSGIVYSNDNIVKGAILTSGYGVKNYKIPKIKRAEEPEVEPPTKDELPIKVEEKNKSSEKNNQKLKETMIEQGNKDKSKEIKNKNATGGSVDKINETIKDTKNKVILKEKHKDKDVVSDTDVDVQKKQTKNDSVSDEHTEKRLTRSSRKNLEAKSVAESFTKPKKNKKLVINDSDSDTEKDELVTTINNMSGLETSTPVSPVKVNEKNVFMKPSAVDIDTNFGLEELEMFSDNVVSDPVIDNINALIADLDNDLNTPKNETGNNFTKEITLENMMQNISSPHEDSATRSAEEFSKAFQTVERTPKVSEKNSQDNPLTDLSNFNKNIESADLGDIKSNDGPGDSQESKSGMSLNKLDEIENVKGPEKIVSEDDIAPAQPLDCNLVKVSNTENPNEDIVSTSESDKDVNTAKMEEQDVDGCSTPDSTINTDDIRDKPTKDGIADSTNEMQSETNVTSTDSTEPKPTSSHPEGTDLESIGSLLSILQNKSKIKDLLSMLSDQSGNNEKMKKKLEKLSEIVSDDENDSQPNEVPSSKSKTSNLIISDIKETENVDSAKDDDKAAVDGEDEENAVDYDAEKTEEAKGMEEGPVTVNKPKKKTPVKKGKFSRKYKGRFAKGAAAPAAKRVTRATATTSETKPKAKKPPRELIKLHEDIKEMFIKEDILNSTTGIRMCRLAKLVDEKTTQREEIVLPEAEPIVVLEKFKNTADKSYEQHEKIRKKPGPKPKPKISTESSPEIEKVVKQKPGPKSKTRLSRESDPYVFETDSIGDTNTEKASEDDSETSSDSELGSLASSKSISGSSELLTDIKKKPKRKRPRRGWQDGVIKPKHKKKKVDTKVDTKVEQLSDGAKDLVPSVKQSFIPDLNCFTDRSYCFRKNEFSYSCRLCVYSGKDIVHHYKNEHPHVEIPLSRIAPQVAKEAIEQCKDLDFKIVGKISSSKYVCVFCFMEFPKNSSVLETFFWHVVSMHTGEYKYDCSICVNESRCASSLDIPPPPPDQIGQLIGYICRKCNFIQLSLENLKTHVIVRHNDEQTAVYTINLAAMTKKDFKDFLRRCNAAQVNKLQVTKQLETVKNINVVSESELPRSKPVTTPTNIQSKITFEADDNASEISNVAIEGPSKTKIKIESADTDNTDKIFHSQPPNEDIDINRPSDEDGSQPNQPSSLGIGTLQTSLSSIIDEESSQASDDIVDYPHFKINITASGAKEYICCINAKDNHFKTTLLISMKKHVQFKHSENWDGYCFVCKVIVTPQGAHPFKDCFQHYLDKHIDNFPIYKEDIPQTSVTSSPAQCKSFINVRPLSDLISTEISEKECPILPVIQNVISLGPQPADVPQPSPSYPAVIQENKPSEVPFKYEEVQADVMSKKHRVVLETMMTREKLINVYKCAGRFCSFTSDSAEDSLLHASTHQRIGGIDALNCCYCDFNAMGNAIDLVMHVFRVHGHCQFACGQCFYRAVASQSVGVHMSRVHGVNLAAVAVLRATAIKPNTLAEPMMTREQAVPYYVCKHAESDDFCKFRTYTPDKFCEHLQQRHADATTHPCYLCPIEVPSPSELVQHMKSHGLKLYQCTWCVFGANNENELLTHYSVLHPTKQPQTYVRIITNKEGSNELRVLPLAFLNKLKVATEDVIPSMAKENPAREAERSLDLEKLIGLTMFSEPMQTNETVPQDSLETTGLPDQTLHSVTALINPQLDNNLPVTETDNVTMLPENTQKVTENSDTGVTVEPVPIATVDPLPKGAQVSVKTEPSDKAKPMASDVVVLDSDDDDNSSNPKRTKERIETVELSDEDHSVSPQKTSTSEWKAPVDVDKQKVCPKCLQVCKSLSGMKKHLHYCYRNKDEPCKCPHCQFYAKDRNAILMHYTVCHNERDTYVCGLCNLNFMSVNLVKKHMKNVHKEKDLRVTTTSSKGSFRYTVNVASQELQKKKASSTETAKRRFWPHEINQLPVNAILDHLVYCEECGFSTKVRLNMFRHLRLHAQQQPVAQTAPVNPVPHLETNEMHFDKMVNLASSSSSVGKKVSEPPPADKPANFVGIRMPAETAARYPKQISARERNTCGAIGCTYISVDEAMLKRHWEALHSGNTNFRCVHCPQTQTLDTSRPLTAPRVLSHLRMHDGTLYACSKCHYYHYKRDFLERHLTETHQNTGELLIVREDLKSARVSSQQPTAALAAPPVAPTMDLKPWQCGFCKFKSMLRPEVVDHCFNIHQSKMQFRCAHCPYRASAIENVNNHLAHSHANEPEEIIYYYYREGSLPDEDGVPKWVKQRQQMGSNVPEVKTENQVSPVQSPARSPVTVDLNLVKTEVVEEASPEAFETVEDLCKRFGEFSEPNGIKYKCPLCNIIMEDTREAMQSHLYEELKYRKWGCGICTYKAFHKEGLSDHMTSEHRRQSEHIQLPTNTSIETWVTAQLDHQAAIIEKHKSNLAQQKIIVERANPGPSSAPTLVIEPQKNFTVTDLENAFGSFGASKNMMYCCPKCGTLQKDEALMRDHLETELNKIRWGCNNCPAKFQTYHEAQFHCKTHDVPSNPKEAIRAPAMRAAWVTAILQTQRDQLQTSSATSYISEPTHLDNNEEQENSLLVVRYEERVPTPDQITRRKRPAAESDDERLVIDEPARKRSYMRACPYCDFQVKQHSAWREHILKHFNLKPYTCSYCDFSSYRQSVIDHTERMHPSQPPRLKLTEMPSEGPSRNSPKRKTQDDDPSKLICLICEKSFSQTDADTHLHNDIKPDFAKKGDVVVKCCICLHLRVDVKSLQDHHNTAHPNQQVNYALFKLHFDTRETHNCDHCNTVFKYIRDLKSHHNAVHATLPLRYTPTPYIPQSTESVSKQIITQSLTKRSARKSTTKLPGNKSVAKKSTTKLPYSDSSSSDEEYSYYNTRAEPLEKYAKVTTLMSFCNRMVPFTLKKLSEIINIEPKVIVQDIKNSNPSDMTR